MASGIEGVGEAVTGGMFARAVEPSAGEASERSESACLNCGAALDGAYCRDCGQKSHVHRSIGAIRHDLVHGVLHLAGKFWRTLPLLVWWPGELTRRYAHGERAKFVSPMAMFLFSIFLMFAVLSIYGLSLANLDARQVNLGQGLDVAQRAVAVDLAEARSRRAALDRGEVIRDERGRPATAAALDAEIAQGEQEHSAIERLRRGTRSGGRITDLTTGWERLDKGLRKLNENPSLALYKLQANGYKFSWLLIPISVPFVWVLFFWTRRFRFYDHTVFVTYSLAFMSMLAVVLTVAGFAGVPTPLVAVAGVFVPPIHMFLQLKGAYGLGWFGALLRTFILVQLCFCTATFFFILLLGIGALG